MTEFQEDLLWDIWWQPLFQPRGNHPSIQWSQLVPLGSWELTHAIPKWLLHSFSTCLQHAPRWPENPYHDLATCKISALYIFVDRLFNLLYLPPILTAKMPKPWPAAEDPKEIQLHGAPQITTTINNLTGKHSIQCNLCSTNNLLTTTANPQNFVLHCSIRPCIQTQKNQGPIFNKQLMVSTEFAVGLTIVTSILHFLFNQLEVHNFFMHCKSRMDLPWPQPWNKIPRVLAHYLHLGSHVAWKSRQRYQHFWIHW